MKRVVLGKGFILSFLINFALRYEWGLISMMLLAFHFAEGLSVYYCFVPLIIWFIHALTVTLIYRAISRVPSDIHKKRPNKNPYSKKTGDYVTVESQPAKDNDETAAEGLKNS